MSDANLQAVFFDFDGVICQTEVCRLDALEVRLHALGLHPDRRGLYRMVSGGLGSREAAMDALLGSQPLYWQHREEVLARHPIRFCYPQLLTPACRRCCTPCTLPGLCWQLFPIPAWKWWTGRCSNAASGHISSRSFPAGRSRSASRTPTFTVRPCRPSACRRKPALWWRILPLASVPDGAQACQWRPCGTVMA